MSAPDEGLTANMQEMADILRISLPTLRDMIRDYADFPVLARGKNGVAWKFEPATVIAFVKAKREAEATSKAERSQLLAQISLPEDLITPPDQQGLTAKEREQRARAGLKEDELAKQRGFLVSTHEMRSRITPVWQLVQTGMLSIPSRVGRKHNLPDAVIRDIRRETESVLRQAHAKAADLLRDAEPPPDADSPPE